MVDAKRYVIHYDARGEQEHPKGDFVHWHDYQALSSQLAEAELKQHSARDAHFSILSEERAARVRAEAERDRLAAELELAKPVYSRRKLERKVAVAKEALLECKRLNGMDRPVSCSDVAEAAIRTLTDGGHDA